MKILRMIFTGNSLSWYSLFRVTFSLKTETAKNIESLDHQVQEQEKLRQHARTMLSILQRSKVQLIELRPTLNGESDQKLKKIDADLMKNYNLFEQVVDDYKNDYGNFSDDIDKMINRVYEDTEDIKARFSEKVAEFQDFDHLRNEYEVCYENLSKIVQQIESKSRLNLDLLKVNPCESFLWEKCPILGFNRGNANASFIARSIATPLVQHHFSSDRSQRTRACPTSPPRDHTSLDRYRTESNQRGRRHDGDAARQSTILGHPSHCRTLVETIERIAE